ncbi:hypothetical protein ACSDQ9_00650 [Aestuariimicrobium soli]|uniref:hypothetical protein n=1 Tax=Aestuariimicrobium soli TaxID=2035834 RepID=UPI003EB942CC
MNAVARGMLAISCFVFVGSLMLMFMVERGTAEFYVTVISLGVSLIAVAGATLVARWTIQRPNFKEEQR